MKLTAIMPVRNEACVLGLSARVALKWCDELILLNHASTDNTGLIIEDLQSAYGSRVKVISVPESHWYEMQHRQMLLNWARNNGQEGGATHIALVDADEVLTGNLLGSIREHIANLSNGYMMTLPLYYMRGAIDRYHLNGIWGQRIVSVAFKDVNTANWRGDKYHDREPEGVQWIRNRMPGPGQGSGGVMHLWGVSERRLRAKHALYKVTERISFPEKPVQQIEREFSWAIRGDPGHSMYGTPETWTYAEAPTAWWEPYRDLLHYMDFEGDPWQEAEVRRLVSEHGADRFCGLNLFCCA